MDKQPKSNSSSLPIPAPTRKIGGENEKSKSSRPQLRHRTLFNTQIHPSAPFSRGRRENPLLGGWHRSLSRPRTELALRGTLMEDSPSLRRRTGRPSGPPPRAQDAAGHRRTVRFGRAGYRRVATSGRAGVRSGCPTARSDAAPHPTRSSAPPLHPLPCAAAPPHHELRRRATRSRGARVPPRRPLR
jgi:hypothetical protein